MQDILFAVVWLPLVAALVGGYLGALTPLGDSLAVFRLELAIAAGLVSILLAVLGGVWAAVLGGLLALAAAVPIVWSMRPMPAGEGLVLYQKNLLYRSTEQAGLVDDIRAVGPDVVTLQELSAPNQVIPPSLEDILPHSAICPFDTVGSVAVLSRWPIEEVRCDQEQHNGLVVARVDAPDGPVWIASVHLHWPWPFGQRPQLEKMLPVLAALDGPVIMAGDFNMVSWSSNVRCMAAAIEGRALGPSMITRVGRWVGLRIDHVIAPEGMTGAIERRGLIGSDHYGIVARMGPLP